MENIYEKLENILDLIENITLLETKLPEKTGAKIYDIEDYIKIPDNYEQDCYVDFDNLPDFSALWKKQKPDLKLYINNEYNKDKE